MTRLLAGMLPAAFALTAAIYAHLRGEIIEQYDATLVAKARALAALVEQRADGTIDFAFAEKSMPEYGAKAPDADFFQIRRRDGSVLARSPSLPAGDLIPPGLQPDVAFAGRKSKGIYPINLPSGKPGRGVWIRFRAAPAWKGDHELGRPATAPTAANADRPPLALWLASYRTELDETLNHFLLALAAGGGALAVVTVAVVVSAVRGGLRPLHIVADAAATVDADHLNYRFETENLPTELWPICERLNDLLARLGEAFGRERRFSANVAHELRTPIAELRTAAEVALRWPSDAKATTNGFRQSLAIAGQMESIVATLLALVRSQGGRQAITWEAIDLAAVMREAWAPHAAIAERRGLVTAFEVADPLRITTNGPMLASLLDNLFANAVAYTPAGGHVVVRAEADPTGSRIKVTNTSANLSIDDLPHLCEPFWRKDAARSDGTHSGLGLALAKSYAAVLGLDLEFDLPEPNEFQVTLALAGASL